MEAGYGGGVDGGVYWGLKGFGRWDGLGWLCERDSDGVGLRVDVLEELIMICWCRISAALVQMVPHSKYFES